MNGKMLKVITVILKSLQASTELFNDHKKKQTNKKQKTKKQKWEKINFNG